MSLNRELAISITFILFGSIFLAGSLFYEIGTLGEMGSGYFPALISSILILLGFLNFIRGFKSLEPIDLNFRIPLTLFIIILLTSLIAKYQGMILATAFVIAATSRIHKNYSVKNCLITISIGVGLIIILKLTLLRAMIIW